MNCQALLLRSIFAIYLAATYSPDASADIRLSLDVFGSTSFDTGTAGPGKQIDFFISQDAADSLIGTSPAFEIEAGILTGGTAGDGGAVGTPGYFGAGQWQSSLLRIPSPQRFEVSQEAADFLVGVTPLISPAVQRYFTLELDTTGLMTGSYDINIRPTEFNFATLDGRALRGIPSNTSFAFTVTAIPEPTSTMVILLGTAVTLTRRRRQRIE